ncbi:hypothetical protein [Streptococcus pneumoniae]|uniref:hypothetical protein n=1 Tax=Streptococcus pneumoniae TaxID=1313 RepID=UPI0015D99CAD|nr:hypothetical protein [Streptococcus pneumoniae]
MRLWIRLTKSAQNTVLRWDGTDEVSSKHGFKMADETDEVSSKHCFKMADGTDEVSNRTTVRRS